eukprot:JP439229.1.p2 GENE.JP439229.1~~JP439229.1.p2  ORF type:complete len:121 (+),score=30.71 JP439229.1:3-365(+)
MREELETFADVGTLRTNVEARKKQLSRTKNVFTKRREALRQQVQVLNQKYDKKKAQLSENETATTLEALEQKLRYFEGNIFHLDEYVQTKTRESDFATVRDSVNKLASEINTLIVKNQQT